MGYISSDLGRSSEISITIVVQRSINTANVPIHNFGRERRGSETVFECSDMRMNSQSLAGRLVRGASLPPGLVWAGMQMSQDIWMHMLQRTEDAPGDRCTAARCPVNTDRSFKRARTGGSGCRRRGGQSIGECHRAAEQFSQSTRRRLCCSHLKVFTLAV